MSIIENLSELSLQYFAFVRQVSSKFELTLSQTLVLLSIPFDGITISDLSEKLGIDISTMTRNIQRIEKKKLIKRLTNPNDKRSIKLFLSKRGSTLSDSINSELKLGIDYYNSSYRAIGNNYLGTPYHNIAKQKIFEPFSILRLNHSSVSNLEYEIGFRLHYYDIDADNYSTKKSLLSNDRHNYAWSMGLNYNIQNQGDIFAHISRAFRSPRLDELISLVSPSPSLTDLKHQFSNDLEVGYEKENKDSRYKLAIFRSLIKNQIVYNSAAWANQNFDPSIQQGLEIEFDKSINEKFNLKSNAAYIDSYFSKGTEKGNETPYVPKLSSAISLYYYLENESDLSLEHKYIGKQRAGNDPNYNVRKSKSYQITDLNFTHKIQNFRLKASVNNVFNKKYYTNLIASGSGDAYVYPQPGRTLFLGLEATF